MPSLRARHRLNDHGPLARASDVWLGVGMEVTKKQQALLSALGLGLIVLAAERLMPGPETALAGTTPAPAAPGESADLDAPAPEVENGVSTFSERLRTLATERGLDPARTPDVFDTGLAPAHESGAAQPDPGVMFLSEHSLTSVIVGDRPAAVVDGDMIRVGDRVDGFTLVRVGARSAQFVMGSTTVSLKLDEDL